MRSEIGFAVNVLKDASGLGQRARVEACYSSRANPWYQAVSSEEESPEELGPAPLNATGLCQFVINSEGMDRKGRSR